MKQSFLRRAMWQKPAGLAAQHEHVVKFIWPAMQFQRALFVPELLQEKQGGKSWD